MGRRSGERATQSKGPRVTRIIRAAGWFLIAFGTLVVLYISYQLLYTNTLTSAAQEELLEDWRIDVDESDPRLVATDKAQRPAAPTNIPTGDAVAVMTFRRPGSEEAIVYDGPLAIVEGVTPEVLKRGPGRYPGTAMPGETGNFAIAGHRTTYGAPFFHLDLLQRGDVIDVVDRDGKEWTYVVRRQEVVEPEDTWTLQPDPLGRGTQTLTLTTCYPRFSDAQRLVVFAELRST